jgi:hypothetical protein
MTKELYTNNSLKSEIESKVELIEKTHNKKQIELVRKRVA